MTETQASSGDAGIRPPPDILRRIVRTKRAELEELRGRATEIRDRAADAPPAHDFHGALRGGGRVSLVAEVKRRSPGAGEIRPGLDPVELAATYAANGASAISVLTDREYFGGGLDDLGAVRSAVDVPLLRKDFTLDPLQIAEARAGGADAVLLIVRILDDPLLGELHEAARAAGLAALVEVHDAAELARATACGARLLGINNRDLSTFTTDLATTLDLLADVPADAVVVSESGIRTAADVARLGREGVDAVLVGESLLRSDDPGAHAARLSGVRRTRRAPEGGAPRG